VASVPSQHLLWMSAQSDDGRGRLLHRVHLCAPAHGVGMLRYRSGCAVCPGVPASALVRGFGCDSKVVGESQEMDLLRLLLFHC
jgi:hypothetical protein